MNNKNIKHETEQFFRRQLAQGNTITVHWDAGGDSTPVWVEYATPPEGNNDEFEKELRYEIIDKLTLPNAGEEYHTGRGKLVADESGLFLEFTAYEHEWMGARIPEVVTVVDDKYNLSSGKKTTYLSMFRQYEYLTDTYITDVRLNRNGVIRENLLDEMQIDFYSKILEDAVDMHRDKAGKEVQGSEGMAIVQEINASLNFDAPHKLQLRVTFTCHAIKAVHSNELVQLFVKA